MLSSYRPVFTNHGTMGVSTVMQLASIERCSIGMQSLVPIFLYPPHLPIPTSVYPSTGTCYPVVPWTERH